jgi:hypothetical protein
MQNMHIKGILFAVPFLLSIVGCATLTSDPMTPIEFSFSDDTTGKCHLRNKRGAWKVDMPDTVYVRRSDDLLIYSCENESNVKSTGEIPSTISPKMAASIVFLDLGITDAITDKHREYPRTYVVKSGEHVAAPKKEEKPKEDGYHNK